MVESIIEAYKNFWLGITDFKGRTSVKGYWFAVLAHTIVNIVLAIIMLSVARTRIFNVLNICFSLFQFMSVIPSLAIALRRLRDAGLPWTNMLWVLLPIVGAVILIVKLCKPSADGVSQPSYVTRASGSGLSSNMWMILAGVLVLFATAIGDAPVFFGGILGYMNGFWWISRISLVAFAILLLMGNKSPLLLISPVIMVLTGLRTLVHLFHYIDFFNVLGWAAACALIALMVLGKKKPSDILLYIPAGIFLIATLITFYYAMRHYTSMSSVITNLLRAIAMFCLGRGLVEEPSKELNTFGNYAALPSAALPPLPSEDVPSVEKKVPGVLLVRYSIDKLNNLGGSYGFQSGKLIGKVVPASLMEGMSISDGDSAATLSGREYVCVVGIASNDISILKQKIEPLILASEEIKECGDDPITQVVNNTREPLVLDGIVSNGDIIGGGGWCANGFKEGWKEAPEIIPEPVPEVRSSESIGGGGKTIRSASGYQPKPNVSYKGEIISLLLSVLLILGGASGQFVLRGTNSSVGLMLVGLGYLAWDIYSIIKKRTEAQKSTDEYNTRQERMQIDQNNAAQDKRTLPYPVNIRISYDAFLSNIDLGPRLNGNPVIKNAGTNEYVGSTGRVKNILNFSNTDLTAVFEINPDCEEIIIELFQDMNGIGMVFPDNVRVLSRNE